MIVALIGEDELGVMYVISAPLSGEPQEKLHMVGTVRGCRLDFGFRTRAILLKVIPGAEVDLVCLASTGVFSYKWHWSPLNKSRIY